MSWDPTRPGNTRQARTMRDRVLREEPTCRVPGCGQPSVYDDHIVGWSEREIYGMTVPQWHQRSNHQGLCEGHHAEKTGAERARGRARNGATPSKRTAKRTAEPHPGRIAHE